MRILVAGATGVLGRRVVSRLCDDGHEVLGVSRREDADRWLADAGAHPVRLDLFDADAATALAAGHGVDAVANLATHVPGGPDGLRRRAWKTHLRLRRDASHALATAAVGAGARFVQESFAPAYPDRGSRWIDEDTPLEPVAQAATVPDAEASAEQVTAAGGVGVALRFGLLYGPEASADLLAAARRGRLLLPGDPEAYVSMVHVEDAAAAVVAAFTAPAGIYNVVEDTPAKREEHAVILAGLLGVPRVRPLPRVLGRLALLRTLTRSQRVANTRIKHATGWQPTYPDARRGWAQTVGAEHAVG